jgi:hypothetical protein
VSGLIKKIVRAAVAQPWEYTGNGAPQEWEFRVSQEAMHFAAYDPQRGTWVVLDAQTLLQVAEVTDLSEMDKGTADWSRFVEELDDDEH